MDEKDFYLLRKYVMTKDELDKLLVRASNYTARYEKSSKEVSEKLYKWSEGAISQDEQEWVIEELKKDKFIDEVRFTERFIKDKMVSYRKGPIMIRRELFMKGIPQNLIEDELSKIDDEEWVNNLRDYLMARFDKQRKKAKNKYDLKMRLGQLAYTRGYLREHSDPVIEEMIKDVEGLNDDEYWYD